MTHARELLDIDIANAARSHARQELARQEEQNERARRAREADEIWRHSWKEAELKSDPGPQRLPLTK